MAEPYIKKGDVVGCALDLSVPVMTFYLNGVKVKGNFRNMNLDGMFFPVVSLSARVRYPKFTVNISNNVSFWFSIQTVADSCLAANTGVFVSRRRSDSRHCTRV